MVRAPASVFRLCGWYQERRLLSHKVVHVIPIVVHTSTTSAAKQVLEIKNILSNPNKKVSGQEDPSFYSFEGGKKMDWFRSLSLRTRLSER